MNDINRLFDTWKNETKFDDECQRDLAFYESDEDALKDAFYKDLAFGTAGVRGIMGAGTNRMNIYTLGKVIYGLSKYLLDRYENPKVVIGYDVRNNSKKFSDLAALILKDSGIEVMIFPDLTPVSLVSYGVMKYNCSAGLILTASHNPREFNGCKVFNESGHQIVGAESDQISAVIDKVDTFNDIDFKDLNKRLSEDGLDEISKVPDSCYEEYMADIKKLSLSREGIKDLKVLFSPLNGVGRRPVTEILGYIGVSDIFVIPEQTYPDSDFKTCPYPNPEKMEAYDLALKYAKEYHPDLIMLTDPDCDRVGVMVPDDNGYRLLNGDEVAILLFDFICNRRELPDNGYMLRSIVSNNLVDRIASKFGLSVGETLTGFKNMGLIMKEKEDAGEERDFVFAFEESIGYLPGTFAKDKDGVSIAMLIAQMSAYYKAHGKMLLQRIDEIYEEYGYQLCHHIEFNLKGSKGKDIIDKIMEELRKNPLEKILDQKVSIIEDYLLQKRYDIKDGSVGELKTDESNVLIFKCDNDDRLAIRPSGTEPKLKVYIFTNGDAKDEVLERQKLHIESINHEISNLVERFS